MTIKKGYCIRSVENFMIHDDVDKESINHIKEKSEECFNEIISTEDFKTGLILGKVQSGKTYSMLMTIATATDNNIKNHIILTSSDSWIYDQTVARVRQMNMGLYLLTKDKFQDDIDLEDISNSYNGLIIVCNKNSTRLSQLCELLESSKIVQSDWIIFDDEADNASLNTNIRKFDEDPSTINEFIQHLFELLNCKSYIQVTATPQALLLQNEVSPFKPDFIIVPEPGKNYVGGNILFSGKDSIKNHLRIYDDEDMFIKFNDETVLPEGLKDAICNFLIAATEKFLKGNGISFSFICHATLSQEQHFIISSLIEAYTRIISHNLRKFNDSSEIGKRFHKQYNDLSKTIPSISSFEEIIDILKHSIGSKYIQVINAESETKQPDYNSRYNFIIGGTKLSRGVTIKKLLTTYYTRQVSAPKMDTIHQHARMYGYRKDDLDGIRIFITDELARRFDLINRCDELVRDYIINSVKTNICPLFIPTRMKPTRDNVLPEEVMIYQNGKSYFPHFPEYEGDEVRNSTEDLNKLLDDYIDNGKNPAKEVSIDFLIKVLNHTKSKKLTNEFWRDEAILAIFKQLKVLYNNKGYIVIRTDRNISNNTTRGISALLAAGEATLNPGDLPTLFIYRLNGSSSNN